MSPIRAAGCRRNSLRANCNRWGRHLRLTELITALEEYVLVDPNGSIENTEVDSLVMDHRETDQQSAFFALAGSHFDGHDYVKDAYDRGAPVAFVQHHVESEIPQVILSSGNPRAQLALLSATLWRKPSEELTVLGVTGTNGKTTSVHMLSSILRSLGVKTDALGTLWGRLTTPEAPELQRKLREFKDAGADAVAMEVSSHSLVMHRVDGVSFQAALFTNLSQDHLDFHHDMETYFRAKAMLFDPVRSEMGIVNQDDPYGQVLLDKRSDLIPYSIRDTKNLELDRSGIRFSWRGHLISSPLNGVHNVYNILGVLTTLVALECDESALSEAVPLVGTPNGRMELIANDLPISVFVDYAHTPAALEAALLACRTLSPKRVLVVFGCGGERDKQKRPKMGSVASALADATVVTSDNSRNEDPAEIAREVLSGIAAGSEVILELDRQRAIELAINMAEEGDLVLIAGKGHETTQRSQGKEAHFDDHEVARQILKSKFGWSLS